MMKPYIVHSDPALANFNLNGGIVNADHAVILAKLRKTTLRNQPFDFHRDIQIDLLDARFFYTTMQGI